MENWLDEFGHPKLDTPEKQESAKNTLKKFASKDDVVVGYVDLEKTAGKPYKLPESIDKLPENVRTEFKDGAMKLLNIEPGVTDDTVKSVNFKKGLADGKEANETVVNKLKEFATKNGLSLAKTQNLVELVNAFGTEQVATFNEEQKAAIKADVEKTGQVLDLYFGAEKRKVLAEKLQSALRNNCGLSVEEYESLADDLGEEGYIFQRPALAKVLMDKIAPLAVEDTTKAGDVNETKTETTTLADEGFTKSAQVIGLK